MRQLAGTKTRYRRAHATPLAGIELPLERYATSSLAVPVREKEDRVAQKSLHPVSPATGQQIPKPIYALRIISSLFFQTSRITRRILTGAQRTNIDYLLLNLIDPSSSISNDFRMQIIETTDGRVVTGLLIGESDNAITVQTATEKLVIPTIEIEQRVISQVSMMPEGLLQRLTPEEVRDLFAYITGPDQVPLPPDSNGVPVEKPM